jgi:glycosyltransferase involved in cell wall biosynthesis
LTLFGTGKESGMRRLPVNKVLAISDDVSKRLTDHGMSPKRLITLSPGIDTSLFDRARFDQSREKQRLGIPAGAKVVGSCAVISEMKGAFRTLRAFKAMTYEDPRLQLVHVGDGPDRERFDREVEALGLEGKVHCTGWIDDPAPVLSTMDVLLHLAEFETYGMAVAEAMSMGVVPVTGDVGGVSDLVRGAGTLVQYNDTRAAASAALALLRDDGVRAEMSAACRQRIVDEHSVDKMVAELEGVYSLVNKPPHA